MPKPSFLNFLLNKARQIIAPDDDGQVQAEIDQIVPQRPGSSALSAIPGYAGGNLGQQLNPMIAPRPERTDELAPSDTIRPRGSFGGDAPPVESITRPGITPQPLSTSNAVPATEPSIKPITPQLPLPDRNPALTSARQGFDDARNQPLTFGTDKAGNARYAPEKGFMGRFKAGGKIFGQGGGLPGFVQGAISPELPAKMRRSRLIGEAGQNLQAEMGIAREQSQIEENQAQAERYSKMPLPASPESAQQERERDNLRAAWQAIVTSGQEFDPNNAEHKQIHDRAQGLGMPLPYGTKYIRPGAEKVEVTAPDGTKLMVSPNEALTYKAGQVKPLTGTETPASRAERRRRVSAARNRLTSLNSQETQAASRKDAAFTELGRIQREIETDPENESLKAQLQTAREVARQAQSDYVSFADKKTAVQAELDENADTPPTPGANRTLDPEVEKLIRNGAVQRGLNPDVAVQRALARQ